MQNLDVTTNQEKDKIKASIAAMEIEVNKDRQIKECNDIRKAVEGVNYIDTYFKTCKGKCEYYKATRKNGQDVILEFIKKEDWYRRKKGQLTISSTESDAMDNYIKQITGITEEEITDIKNMISKIQEEKDESYKKEKIAKIIMDKEIRKSLERELEILIKCKSDNVVSCSGFFEVEDWVVFELEYYKDDLKEYINENGPLLKSSGSRKTYNQIFSGVIGALKELKSKGIIHNNIRTSHIVYDENMKIKLKGFEYAIYTSDAEKNNYRCNRCFYVAPEIVHDREGYNEKSDLWSIGIVLYELYFGKLPYGHEPLRGWVRQKTDTQKAFDEAVDSKKDKVFAKENPILALILRGLLQVDPKLRLSYEQLFELAKYDIFSDIRKPQTEDFCKKYNKFMKQNKEDAQKEKEKLEKERIEAEKRKKEEEDKLKKKEKETEDNKNQRDNLIKNNQNSNENKNDLEKENENKLKEENEKKQKELENKQKEQDRMAKEQKEKEDKEKKELEEKLKKQKELENKQKEQDRMAKEKKELEEKLKKEQEGKEKKEQERKEKERKQKEIEKQNNINNINNINNKNDNNKENKKINTINKDKNKDKKEKEDKEKKELEEKLKRQKERIEIGKKEAKPEDNKKKEQEKNNNKINPQDNNMDIDQIVKDSSSFADFCAKLKARNVAFNQIDFGPVKLRFFNCFKAFFLTLVDGVNVGGLSFWQRVYLRVCYEYIKSGGKSYCFEAPGNESQNSNTLNNQYDKNINWFCSAIEKVQEKAKENPNLDENNKNQNQIK